MKSITLLVVLLLPALGYAGAMNGNETTQPSLTMLLFILGSVTSVLFIKGRQDAYRHTGYAPIIQSLIISVCFIWSHYILLVVQGQSLYEFYSNFILHIDKAFVGFMCVVFLYVGFVAVIFRMVKIGFGRIKRLRQ